MPSKLPEPGESCIHRYVLFLKGVGIEIAKLSFFYVNVLTFVQRHLTHLELQLSDFRAKPSGYVLRSVSLMYMAHIISIHSFCDKKFEYFLISKQYLQNTLNLVKYQFQFYRLNIF